MDVAVERINVLSKIDTENKINSGSEVNSEKSQDKMPQFMSELAQNFYINAKVLIHGNECLLAISLLRQALNLESKNTIIMSLLCEQLIAMNKLDEAEVIALKNYQIKSNVQNSVILAEIYYLKNKNDESLQMYYECLSQVIENHDHLFKIFKNMGNIYTRLKEYELAEEYYHKAYQINSHSAQLIVNIGVLEYQKKDWEKSIECFRKAIHLESNDDKAWVGLAMIYYEYGDRELCWGNLVKAIDINPNNKSAILLLCKLYSSSEKVQICRDHLINYLKVHNFDEEISLVLIQMLVRTGDYVSAYLESCKCHTWNPKNEQMYSIYKELSKIIQRG